MSKRRKWSPDRHRKYWKPYQGQMMNAEQRGIEFKLTYKQWLGLWVRSGHLDERGIGAAQYCMARHADSGAYEVGNVSIITNRQNAQVNYKRRSQSKEERDKRSKTITAWHASRRVAKEASRLLPR